MKIFLHKNELLYQIQQPFYSYLIPIYISIPNKIPFLMSKDQKKPSTNFGLDEQYQYTGGVRNINDERTPEQIVRQSKYVKELTNKNIEMFGLNELQKKKTKPVFSEVIKVEVGNNWFGIISDNNIVSEFAIVTLHGMPGNEKDWAYLESQMNGEYRWINFVAPGFDELDQRRGDYSGTAQDMCKLIVLILEKRGVKEFVFCGFSGGTFIAPVMYYLYPNLMIGEINLAGQGYTLSTAVQVSISVMLNDNGFGFGPQGLEQINERKKLLNNEQFREKIYHKYIKRTNQVMFSERGRFIQLKKNQLCASIKMSNCFPEGVSQACQLRRNNMKIFRMVAFAEEDATMKIQMPEQYIYDINHNVNRFYVSDGVLKKKIQTKVYQRYGIKLDAGELQKYFCIIFPKAIHYIQITKHKQIARMMKVYLTVLEVMKKWEREVKAKL